VFGPILGERLARAVIGAAPFSSLRDIQDRVSGIGEQKLVAMVSAQLEGCIPAAPKPSPKQTAARDQAQQVTGPGPAAVHGCFGTMGVGCFGATCFASFGGQCFAAPPRSTTSPEFGTRRSSSTGAERDGQASTQRQETMADTPRTPTFEDAYRARLAQIQSY